MSGLRLKLLGGLELRPASGAPIPLPARKPALLLAYLALRPARPQGRDKLAALFWGDSGEAQARASLRQALAFLRRRLGPQGLILTPEGETVALAPDGLATDVAELERCLASGTRGALERAVALYEGDFLDGFQTRQPLVEEWLLVERQRLRERALAAMMALLPETVAADPPEAGVRLALRILALDPLQEAAHRALMRLYARQGRRGAALARYQTLRETLARELGVTPEEETQHLHRELRDRRGGARDDRAAGQAPAAGAGRPPLDAAAVEKPLPPAEAPAGIARAVPPPPERRRLTILVCDLCGAAALASRLDPEETHDLLGRYRRAVGGEIARLEGHVARHTGGEVFAWFGWPRAHEDAAERAVRAGLAAVAAVARLKGPDDRPLEARVGVATGLVVVGDPAAAGSAGETAVVGPAPVLATGLQRSARPGTVLLSGETRGLVGGLFELEEFVGPGQRGGPAQAWWALAEHPVESRFRAQRGSAAAAPMVGRDEELALLLRRWRLAEAGEGQAVLLVGEPGIGKSRVAEALVRTLGGEAHRTVRYQASPQHRNSALWPVAQQLARAAGLAATGDDGAGHHLGRLEAVLADLPGGRRAEALPFLAELLGIAAADRRPSPEMTPQQRRARTLEHLADLVLAAAEREPVLAVTEDAHWLDPTSLELLGLLVGRIGARRVMLLVTSRPDEAPALAGHPHVTRVSLSRLARADVEAIVGRLAGERPLPRGLVEEIAGRADGVPLYVEELTKAVLEAGGEAGAAGPVPASLHDSLMARLDRLEGGKEVAQAAACIGREFPHALAAAVLDHMPAADLEAALARLTAAELVFRRGVPPEATYSFKHALVRDAAHESLLKARRRAIHARIARMLEERFPERAEAEPELLARHCAEAGLAREAVGHWLRAGELATRRSATAEAIAQLRRGLELAGGLPDDPERAGLELDLWTALGGALAAARGFAAPEAGEAYARARELCRGLGRPQQLFRVLYGQYQFHLVHLELDRSLEVAEELLRTAREQRETAPLIVGHRAVGNVSFHRGELVPARAHLERALALYDPRRHRPLAFLYVLDPFVVSASYLSWDLFVLGHPEQARERADAALARARELAHPGSLALALFLAAGLSQFARDGQTLRERAGALLALASEQGFATQAAGAKALEGWSMVERGRASEGIAGIRQGMADYAATGTEMWSPYFLGLLAEAHGRDGQAATGLDVATEALTRVEATGARWIAAELHRLRGELLLALREHDRAEACFRRALAVARAQGARMWELRAAASLARLWADRGERGQARDLLAPVHGRFTEGLGTPDLRGAKELLDGLG